MTRKMKDSGIEWIGEIPETWKVLSLKKIVDFKNGYAFESNKLNNKKDGYPVIKIGDFNASRIDFENANYYKDEIPNQQEYLIKDKDILIAMSGGTVGKNIYVKSLLKDAYINQRVGIIRSNYPELVFYNINSLMFDKYIKLLSLGSAQPNISSYNIMSYKVAFPTDERELKKIIEILEMKTKLIDGIIEDTKRAIEELKQYKQSLITEIVTKGLDKNVEMKDSEIEWIGEYPSHWDVNKINRLFEIKKDIANENGHDVLSVTQKGLKVKDITKNEGQMAADYSKYQIVNKDDFVMNHMDLLTGWVDCSIYEGVTSPDYRVFKNRNYRVANNIYYKYVFQTCYTNKIFYGLGQGVSNLGRWRLQTDKFINFYLPIPPLEEQEAISQFLVAREIEINVIIEEKQKLISEFESYKKSMIYEYVTGKKGVL